MPDNSAAYLSTLRAQVAQLLAGLTSDPNLTTAQKTALHTLLVNLQTQIDSFIHGESETGGGAGDSFMHGE